MPKKVINISKFKQGIHNSKNARDIPEDAIADGLNIMTDIEGKVRQMARDKLYPLTSVINKCLVVPGYGLFTFRSDHPLIGLVGDSITELDTDSHNSETTIIVYQYMNEIGFYTTEDHGIQLTLGEVIDSVKPAFYYSQVDGALRVCDSNFDNISIVGNEITYSESNVFTKYFKFMNKTWFPDLTGADNVLDVKGWITGSEFKGISSFVYPPTVLDYSTAIGTTYRLGDTTGTDWNLVYEHATDSGDTVGDDMAAGNITIQTSDVASIGDADWLAQTLYKFGVSFVYEGGQESQVTNFVETWGDAIAADGNVLGLKVFVHPGNDGSLAFDPRITGCNIYLCGDDSGLYEDPYFLAEFYWGTSSTDKARLTTSDGNYTEAFTLSTNGHISNTSVINVVKTPVITFSMRNGYSNDSKSTAINYKTAIIANRRCYAANIRRYGYDIHTIAAADANGVDGSTWKQPALVRLTSFVENDAMIVSPVDKYDIFPDANRLNIGSNDGDHIVLLIEYADRILQFKQNTVYIINISEDIEYIEEEFLFYGIANPYQAIKTDEGVVWVNNFGCYLYDGDEIKNLIDDKIKPSGGTDGGVGSLVADFSWDNFGKDKMVGYIPKNKQIVVFSSPHDAQDLASEGGWASNGNILIYDIVTESWSHGLDRLPGGIQSNAIIDFSGQLIYAKEINNTTQELSILPYPCSNNDLDPSQQGTNEVWGIEGLYSTSITMDPQGSQLQIGSTAITDIMNYPDDASDANGMPTFAEYLRGKIVQYNPADTFNFLEANEIFAIVRPANKIDGTYTGQSLNWNTADSMGPPVSTAGYGFSNANQNSQTIHFSYQDNSDTAYDTDIWQGSVWHDALPWATNIGNGFEHSINIAWNDNGHSHRYHVRLLQDISLFVNVWGSSPFHVTDGDTPTIKIVKGSGNYTDAASGSFNTLTVDLYSDYLFDNSESLITWPNGILEGFLPGNIGSKAIYGGMPGFDIRTNINPLDEVNLSGLSDMRQISVFYNAAPKVDGSGETDSDASGAALKQWVDAGVGEAYYEAPATMTIPTMIWVKGSSDINIILIPGEYAHRFQTNATYTFSNTGQSANNQTYKFASISQNVYEPDQSATEQYNMKCLTILEYRKDDNSSFFDNVLNWSTSNVVSVASAVELITFAGHNVGEVPRKKEKVIIPRLHGSQDAGVLYDLAITGSDEITYNAYAFDQDSSRNISLKLGTDLFSQYIDISSNIIPWWDMEVFNMTSPAVRGLFCANGVHVTTKGDLSAADTTPFDITLGDGVTALQIAQAVRVGTLLLARYNNNWEIMRVTSIVGTVVTVSRNYLNQSSTGSAVNFGEVTVTWYKTYAFKQISSSQFEIWGDNEFGFGHIFINDVIIRLMALANDSGGGNTFPALDLANNYVIKDSSFDIDNGKTIVNINTDSYTSGNLDISTALAGTNGSVYFPTTISLDQTRFATNMAGDEPGNESLLYFHGGFPDYIPPDRGTTREGGAGIALDNAFIEIYAVHVIENLLDIYHPAVFNGDVSNGVQIRTFSNDYSEGLESSAASDLTFVYLKTREVSLNEDDLFSSNVFYEAQITHRCSQDIWVSMIVNGNTQYVLSDTINDTTVYNTSGSNNIQSITIPVKQLRNAVRAGGGSELVVHTTDGDLITSDWITRKYYLPLSYLPNGSSYLKNVSTIQFLILAPPSSIGFEINDISVVYRPLEAGR